MDRYESGLGEIANKHFSQNAVSLNSLSELTETNSRSERKVSKTKENENFDKIQMVSGGDPQGSSSEPTTATWCSIYPTVVGFFFFFRFC